MGTGKVPDLAFSRKSDGNSFLIKKALNVALSMYQNSHQGPYTRQLRRPPHQTEPQKLHDSACTRTQSPVPAASLGRALARNAYTLLATKVNEQLKKPQFLSARVSGVFRALQPDTVPLSQPINGGEGVYPLLPRRAYRPAARGRGGPGSPRGCLVQRSFPSS